MDFGLVGKFSFALTLQKVNENVLSQEIQALEMEIQRLKEVKAIHKEYRRYVQMPSKSNHLRTVCSRSDVEALRLLPRLEQKEAPVRPRLLRETVQEADR